MALPRINTATFETNTTRENVVSATHADYATDHDFKVFSSKIFSILDSILREKYRQVEIRARQDRTAREDALERGALERVDIEEDDSKDVSSITDVLKKVLGAIVSKIGTFAKQLLGLARIFSSTIISLTASLVRALPRLMLIALRIPSIVALIGGLIAMGLLKRAITPEDQKKLEPTAEPERVERLGEITRKYESGGRGVETISTGVGDAGGVSYGEYQLSSKTGTMTKFLKSPEGSAFADSFKDLEPGTREFDAAYSKVASTRGDEFRQAQHEFIVRTHYEPALKTAGSLGFTVGDRRIQEAVFSSSVQHGRVGHVLQSASKIAASEGRDIRTMTPEEQVPYIYKARSEYVSGLETIPEKTKASLKTRYKSEQEDVLKHGARQPPAATPPSGAPPATPPVATPPSGAPQREESAVQGMTSDRTQPTKEDKPTQTPALSKSLSTPLPEMPEIGESVSGEAIYIQPIVYRTPQIFNNIVAAA